MIPTDPGDWQRFPDRYRKQITTKKGFYTMALLYAICYGLLTVFVCACEGDFEPFKTMLTIIAYIVVIGLFLWFLAVTGWAGLIIILLVCFAIAGFSSMKD